MATYSSILPWKNPCTGEPGRLQSMGLQRVRHDWARTHTHTHTHTHTRSSYSFFHKWRNWGTERFVFSQESCLQTKKNQLGLAKAIKAFFGRFLRNSPIPQKGRWPGPEHRQEPREAGQTKQGQGTSPVRVSLMQTLAPWVCQSVVPVASAIAQHSVLLPPARWTLHCLCSCESVVLRSSRSDSCLAKPSFHCTPASRGRRAGAVASVLGDGPRFSSRDPWTREGDSVLGSLTFCNVPCPPDFDHQDEETDLPVSFTGLSPMSRKARGWCIAYTLWSAPGGRVAFTAMSHPRGDSEGAHWPFVEPGGRDRRAHPSWENF